jgi:rhomboid protease GluP
MRWQQAWQDRKTVARQQAKQVTYVHKFCACGALMDRDERVCPHCGQRAPSWRAQVVKRALGLVVPAAVAVSTTLVVVNALLFMLVVALGGAEALLVPPLKVLAQLGGMIPAEVARGGYPLLLTYGYLHMGLIHFGFNMLVLSQVGPMLEQEIGKSRFFTLYTLALVGGGVARFFFSGPGARLILVGASGALFGLIGFGLAYAHASGGRAGEEMRAFFLRWALYGFVFGFLVRADNLAHLGGFLVGLVLGFVVERERAARDRYTPFWRVASGLCLLATVGAYLWLIMRHLALIP